MIFSKYIFQGNYVAQELEFIYFSHPTEKKRKIKEKIFIQIKCIWYYNVYTY